MAKIIFDKILDSKLPEDLLLLNDNIPEDSTFGDKLSDEDYISNYMKSCKINEIIIKQNNYTQSQLLMMKEKWKSSLLRLGKEKYKEVVTTYCISALIFTSLLLWLSDNAWSFLLMSVATFFVINISNIFKYRTVFWLPPRAILLLSILETSIIYRSDIDDTTKTIKMTNSTFEYRNFNKNNKGLLSKRIDVLYVQDLAKPNNYIFKINKFFQQNKMINFSQRNHILMDENLSNIVNEYKNFLYANNIDIDDVSNEIDNIKNINKCIKLVKNKTNPQLLLAWIYCIAIFIIRFKPNTLNAMIMVASSAILATIMSIIMNKRFNFNKSINYLTLTTIHNQLRKKA